MPSNRRHVDPPARSPIVPRPRGEPSNWNKISHAALFADSSFHLRDTMGPRVPICIEIASPRRFESLTRRDRTLARRETRAHRASPSCLSFDHDYRERLFLQSVSKIHVIAFDLFFFSFLALVFGHRNCYFRFRSGLDFSRIESIGGRLPRRFNTRF